MLINEQRIIKRKNVKRRRKSKEWEDERSRSSRDRTSLRDRRPHAHRGRSSGLLIPQGVLSPEHTQLHRASVAAFDQCHPGAGTSRESVTQMRRRTAEVPQLVGTARVHTVVGTARGPQPCDVGRASAGHLAWVW